MKFDKIAALMLLVMTALFAGCNRSADPLRSSVPVDRPCSVAVIDFNRLCADFDIKVTDGEIVWPDNLKWLSAEIPADRSRRIAEALAPLDCSYMLYYTDNADFDNGFLAARITDREEFDINMAELRKGDPVVSGEYTLNKVDAYNVIVRGEVAWLTRLDIAGLSAIVDRAAKCSLSRLDGVCTALDADGFMRLAVMTDPGTDPDGQTGEWQTGSFRFADTVLAGDFRAMLGDGAPAPTDYLSPVSTDFLRYLPDDLNIVAAVGRNDRPVTAAEIMKRVNAICPDDIYGRQVREAVAMIAPYIAAINGTSAIGLTYTSGTPGGMIMAHMPQAKTDSTVAALAGMAETFGMSPSTDPATGAVTVDLSALAGGSPLSVTACNADGYLLITTFSPDGTYNNSYAPVFEGKDAAAIFNLPLAPVLAGCPYGLRMEMQTEQAETRYKVSFPGADGQAFTATFADLLRRVVER